MTVLMPAVFFGHGNPMNSLLQNDYTRAWAAIGNSVPRPKAVLCVSAHWYMDGCAVTGNAWPRTIHDFVGFPRELFEVQYPAPGDPGLAHRVKELLGPHPVELEEGWGLDHGTWSVLTHVFPNADVPVVQLSIDRRQPPLFHYELGKKLSVLREEGVLVVGSGNLVHNLQTFAWGAGDVAPYDWAERFEKRVQALLMEGKDDMVVNYQDLGHDAMLAAPTPDHYLPLLYVIGMRRECDRVGFPVLGVDGGSISMFSVQIG